VIKAVGGFYLFIYFGGGGVLGWIYAHVHRKDNIKIKAEPGPQYTFSCIIEVIGYTSLSAFPPVRPVTHTHGRPICPLSSTTDDCYARSVFFMAHCLLIGYIFLVLTCNQNQSYIVSSLKEGKT
jgi:hypothetical protein